VLALQKGYYEITWERCKELPTPMYNISAILHRNKVYVMAGDAPDRDTYYHIYCYCIITNHWEKLPSHKYMKGKLQIINGHLTIIGGWDGNTNMATNNVSTFIDNSWTNHFPNLLRARCKPGVVSHSEFVIVAGGGMELNMLYDNIEVLNMTHPFQWMMTNVLLPEPMWDFYPTISNNMILIVGYSGSGNTYTTSYQLPVDMITSSILPSSLHQRHAVQWIKLPSASHYNSRTVPNSHPPVVIGGMDSQFIPTSDVAMLDDSSKTWKRISSLSSPRSNVVVVSVNFDTILVLGGCTGGKNAAGAKANSITTVEKGRITPIKREADNSSADNTRCSIQ